MSTPQGAYTTTVTLLAPAPIKTYRQTTAHVKRTSETAYRIATKRVRNIRDLDADRVALATDQGDWVISRLDYDRVCALSLRPRQRTPPAQTSERTRALLAQVTLEVRPIGTDDLVQVQRLTDALFLVGNAPDEYRVILGCVPQDDYTVVALLHDSSLHLAQDDYDALLALPAWKAHLKYAARRDDHGQRLNATAARLVRTQAVPVLVNDQPGDRALVVRLLSQIAVPAYEMPVDVFGSSMQVKPTFLVDTEPPPVLDDLQSAEPPDLLQGRAMHLPGDLDRVIARFVAAVHRLEHEQAEAARLQEERVAAAAALQAAQAAHQHQLIAQRDAVLASIADPQRLETALAILVYVNRWAKANDKLLYADRRGLYAIKTAILSAGYAAGHITAVGYIQGHFQPFGSIDLPWCADTVLDRAETAAVDEEDDADGGNEDERVDGLIALWNRCEQDGCDRHERERRFVAWMEHRLHALETRAVHHRQPIAVADLEALGLDPCHIPALDTHRYDWDEVDPVSLGALDPEYHSLVVLSYDSPTAYVIFHQPARIAQTFIPPDVMAQIQTQPLESREASQRYGRPIREDESFTHPIASLLEQLGMPVELYCPHGLVDKQAYVENLMKERSYRSGSRWYSGYDDDDDDDGYDDDDDDDR